MNYTKAGSGGGIKICPGDGVLCQIEIGSDREGDPVYLTGFKGRGRQNIEIIR